MLAWSLALTGAASAQDSYSEAWEEALRLEADGQFGDALTLLESWVETYPQDYQLILQLGWLAFQAGDYVGAERHYQRAADLSRGSYDALLGLAWTDFRQGRYESAAAGFRQLLERHPEDSELADALAMAEAAAAPLVPWTPWVSVTGLFYGDHPDADAGLGLAVGVTGTVARHLMIGASYRYGHFYGAQDLAQAGSAMMAAERSLQQGPGPGDGQGPGPGPGPGTDPEPVPDPGAGPGPDSGGGSSDSPAGAAGDTWDRHEVYVSAGPVFARFGLLAQYGRLMRSDDVAIDLFGLSARWSPWGDILLDASYSYSPDDIADVLRVAPSWSMPVHRLLRVRPGLSFQALDGETLWSGQLTLAVHGRPGEVWLGGKVGSEERPVVFSAPAVYDFSGRIRGGGWVGGRVHLGAWSTWLGYELTAVEWSESASDRGLLHFIAVGIQRRL
jgi:tetratricopeptide (TPR) repeat protein